MNSDLVSVVLHALEISSIDFMIYEGLRTVERQAKLVRSGASRTMKSKHIIGRAVDLVPLDDEGQVSWHIPLYRPLIAAVRQAAINVNVNVRTGCIWDRVLNDLTGDIGDEVEAYRARHPGPDFLDYPHIELA